MYLRYRILNLPAKYDKQPSLFLLVKLETTNSHFFVYSNI